MILATERTHIQPPTLFRNESTETPNYLPPPSLPPNPDKWTVQDVCQWLTAQSIPQFSPLVQNNRIDGKELVSKDFITLKVNIRYFATRQLDTKTGSLISFALNYRLNELSE